MIQTQTEMDAQFALSERVAKHYAAHATLAAAMLKAVEMRKQVPSVELNELIKHLFIKLEAASKAANHFNLRCITDAENPSYHTVFEETLLEITIIKKQIIRALLKAARERLGLTQPEAAALNDKMSNGL